MRSVSRDVRLYLEDIERACKKIEPFTTGMTLESFVADERTYDAVLRNLEVLGEAAKRVPDALRAEMKIACGSAPSTPGASTIAQ